MRAARRAGSSSRHTHYLILSIKRADRFRVGSESCKTSLTETAKSVDPNMCLIYHMPE